MQEELKFFLKSQYLSQGGSESDFEALVDMNDALFFIQKLITRTFGGKQLVLTSDCVEGLLRSLTPLEQKKVINEVIDRLFFNKEREQRILQLSKKIKKLKEK